MSDRARLSAGGTAGSPFFCRWRTISPVSETGSATGKEKGTEKAREIDAKGRRGHEPSGTIETDEKTRALKQAAEALERGDFGLARRVLTGIQGKRATVLRERLRADPLIPWLVVACLVLYTVVVLTTVRRF